MVAVGAPLVGQEDYSGSGDFFLVGLSGDTGYGTVSYICTS